MFFRKKKETEAPKPAVQAQPAAQPKAESKDGEVAAAIATALHLYRSEMHDFEQMVLTMQRVMRPYSPWSSKIYGLRKYPRS